MAPKSTQPLKGFLDKYPQEMAFLNYLIDTVKSVAALYGFEQYDGPVIEPLELYVGKTSKEILEEQAFTLKDRNDQALMLRPEITPSLARMVAAKAQELTFPIRYFNYGLRYRYEAPQKGRNREFYQYDFDIIGSDSLLADIELLSVTVEILKKLGGTQDTFVVYINSRSEMNAFFASIGLREDQYRPVLQAIDKRDKVDDEVFINLLVKCGLTTDQTREITQLLAEPDDYKKNFEPIMQLAQAYGIQDYIQVNPMITRGLDYYTGFVFEAKSKIGLTRSLLGGGRYDNLVASFGARPLSGVGFATSDTVLEEFVKDINKVPDLQTTQAPVLVTVFDQSLQKLSIETAALLRRAGIKTELYMNMDTLQKQLKYADKKNIPWVLIIGPEEAKNQNVVLKNMPASSQQICILEDAVGIIKNS